MDSNVQYTNFLSLQGIVKRFPGVIALNGVSFDLKQGEVHALIGENGAGKSTLIKILAGAYTKDEGQIIIKDVVEEHLTTFNVIEKGIATIYQERSLLPEMTVAQNIFLGAEPMVGNNGVIVDDKKMLKDSLELLKSIDMDLPVDIPVKYLSAAQQQMVEIAKALSKHADIIVMDEPTASLTTVETERLLKTIEQLKAQKKGIIFISHKLDEIQKIADRVTVMRDGEVIGTLPIAEANTDVIIKMMVGRSVDNLFPKEFNATQEEVLRVENLTRKNVFEDISFTLRKGEVLGIAGLVGSKRTEIVRAIAGADRFDSGSIYLEGKKLTLKSPHDAISQGIVLVPEDRKVQGLSLGLNINDNILIGMLKKLSKYWFVDFKKAASIAEEHIKKLSIKCTGKTHVVRSLSGGNQQKVVLAKWIAQNPKILILDEPTKGIDVGTKREIYEIMNQLTAQGMAVLIISSELQEVISLSDRILVIREGRLVEEFDHGDADEERIGYCFVGGKVDE